jgi:hypothetical protein
VLEQPGKDVRVAGADPDRVGGQGRVKLGSDGGDGRADERDPVPDRDAVHGLHGALVREAELAAHAGSTQPGSWEPSPSSRIPRIEKWTSSPFGAARV